MPNESLLQQLAQDEKLNINDANQKKMIVKLMQNIKHKTAEDYYYASIIFNGSNNSDDRKLSNRFVTEAGKLISNHDNSPVAREIKKALLKHMNNAQLEELDDLKNKDRKNNPQLSAAFCINCGERGHFDVSCMKPRKK